MEILYRATLGILLNLKRIFKLIRPTPQTYIYYQNARHKFYRTFGRICRTTG